MDPAGYLPWQPLAPVVSAVARCHCCANSLCQDPLQPRSPPAAAKPLINDQIPCRATAVTRTTLSSPLLSRPGRFIRIPAAAVMWSRSGILRAARLVCHYMQGCCSPATPLAQPCHTSHYFILCPAPVLPYMYARAPIHPLPAPPRPQHRLLRPNWKNNQI